MSLYDYERSIELAAKGYPFYALIMAAMRQAGSDNILKLKAAFPETIQELTERYNAPGGQLPEERFRRGTQVVYVPLHAGMNTRHKDCEEGFVTSLKRDDGGKCLVFCRYWSKSDPTELRTRANSEGTPVDRLPERDTRPQEEVDRWLGIIEAEEG